MDRDPVGIVLAAGVGRRYDPTGSSLKLLEPCRRGPRTGVPLVCAAAEPVLRSLTTVFAVVGPLAQSHQKELHSQLERSGCKLVICDEPYRGMGHSIACGVSASADASGWIVALGDMPAIAATTVEAIRLALAEGHTTVAPVFTGRRGHPVGFSCRCRDDLLALDGDVGARDVLERFPPHRIEVDDPGILYDVDKADQ